MARSDRNAGEEKEEDGLPEGASPVSNVTVEHKAARQSAAGTSVTRVAPSFLAALMTPTGMAAGFFALLMTGGFGYFFNKWFQIPGLEDQVQDLEQEVDRLEGEVSRLEDANRQFEDLNDRLNTSVLELEQQLDVFNESLQDFRDLNTELNLTARELQRLNADLRFENDRFNASNQLLNTTVHRLEDNVENLTGQVSFLEDEARDLNGQIDNLTVATTVLQETNQLLDATVETLQSNVTELGAQVDSLTQFNDGLLQAIAYLDEASEDVTSLRILIANLTSALNANRLATVSRLEQSYRNTIRGWDCAIRDTFRSQPFGGDFDTPIGQSSYPLVIDYVDIRIASVLCLDIPNLEQFVERNHVQGGSVPPVTATINQLDAGVTEYALLAMDYYFPDGNEAGLDPTDWEAANYDCRNLPVDQQFRLAVN